MFSFDFTDAQHCDVFVQYLYEMMESQIEGIDDEIQGLKDSLSDNLDSCDSAEEKAERKAEYKQESAALKAAKKLIKKEAALNLKAAIKAGFNVTDEVVCELAAFDSLYKIANAALKGNDDDEIEED